MKLSFFLFIALISGVLSAAEAKTPITPHKEGIAVIGELGLEDEQNILLCIQTGWPTTLTITACQFPLIEPPHPYNYDKLPTTEVTVKCDEDHPALVGSWSPFAIMALKIVMDWKPCTEPDKDPVRLEKTLPLKQLFGFFANVNYSPKPSRIKVAILSYRAHLDTDETRKSDPKGFWFLS